MTSDLSRRQLLSFAAGGALMGLPHTKLMAVAPAVKSAGSPVNGFTEDKFTAVRTAFEKCFKDYGEHGASLCVYMEGREILNLWGGYADAAKTQPMQRDTLIAPASSIKGFFPFCLHKLVQDGKVKYDDLITKYWPEFGQNGKEKTTIRHVLSHMAGLEQTFPANIYAMPTEALFPIIEAAKPAGAPGSYGAYHSQTHMPLVAALVHKITGEDIYTYFRREIAGPWGIDAWLSLPASETRRGAQFIIPTGSTYYPMMVKAGVIPKELVGEPLVTPPYTAFLSPFTNGRGFARAYGAIANGGILDGIRLYSTETAAAFGKTQWSNENWVRSNEFHTEGETFGSSLQSGTMGYLQNSKDIPLGPNPNAYGMPGAGGSLGFVDPDLKMGFGYTTNSWHTYGEGLGPRLDAVIKAFYASL